MTSGRTETESGAKESARADRRFPILVVEDDDRMRTACIEILERAGYAAKAVASGKLALEWLAEHPGDCVVLTDLRMPGMDGIELLRRIKDELLAADVIVMTAFGSIDNAVEAMKRGAVDYVTKPFNRDELLLAIDKACRMRGLESRVHELEEGLEELYRFENFVASSPSMRGVIQRMVATARSDANVLLTGESGTGKDLVARTLHYSGPRSTGPFVPVNCAGLPGELIESELFGHVRGAYTGAVREHEGLIRRAKGGTLFLDEIGEMPAPTQAKLLRVLQDQRVRRVGGTEEEEVEVRFIAATNRPVQRMLEEGRLREDLYYRISVLSIHLPPLRDRPEDQLPLLRHFIDRENREHPDESRIERIDEGVAEILEQHPWPGNVRELHNLVQRCFALGLSGTLTARSIIRGLGLDAAGDAATGTSAPVGDGTSVTSLADAERQAILRALRECDSKAAAARQLEISRKTLYRKLRDYDL